MRFWERWQVGLAAFGDSLQSAGSFVGSLFDERDDDIGHYISLLGQAGKGFAYGLGNFGVGTVQGVTEPIIEGSEFLSDKATYLPRVYATAGNLARSPKWWQEQGYRSGQDLMGEPVQFSQAILDGETWSKAWELAKTTSLGQAGWRGFRWDGQQVDVLDPGAVAKLQDDPLFNAASGLTDAAVSWYLDPAAGAGKVVKAAKNVRNIYGAGYDSADPWLERMLAKSQKLRGAGFVPSSSGAYGTRVDEFLAWASNKSARHIMQHPMIAKSTRRDDFAGVIAGLLDRQDADTARLVLSTAFGSTKAYDQIAQLDLNLAQRISFVREATNLELDQELFNRRAFGEFVGFRDNRILDRIDALDPKKEGYEERLRNLLVQHDQIQRDIFNATLGEYDGASGLLYSAINQKPTKAGIRQADRHAAYETGDLKTYLTSAGFPQAITRVIQPQPFGVPIRMVAWFPFKVAQGFTNKRPPSWVDPNRSDAVSGLVSYMKHSKVFDETRVGQLTNEYLNALSVGNRRKVVEQIEAEAVKAIARRYGVPGQYAELLAKAAVGRRNSVIAQLKTGGKQYFLDADGAAVRWPLFESQQINNFPLLDLQEFRRVMARQAGGLVAAAHDVAGFVDHAFTAFNSIWSVGQLLRIGYGQRNIADSGLRIAATMGAMTFAAQAADGLRAGIGGNLARRAGNTLRRAGAGLAIAVDSTRAAAEAAIHRDPLAAFQGLRDRTLERVDRLGRDLGEIRTQSNLGIEYRGYTYHRPYYGKAEPYQVLASSSFRNLADSRDDLLRMLRKEFGAEETINPTDRGHLEAWTHIIKNVMGKSELAKQFFMGKTYDEVLTWLTKDPKGQNVLRKVGGRGIHPRAIVGEAMGVVDTFAPLISGADPTILRRMAFEGTLEPRHLEEFFPTVASRPQIWNPAVSLGLRESPGYKLLDTIVRNGFKLIAQMPEDKLIRNPTFRHMLIGNIQRYHKTFQRQQLGQPLTNVDLDRISHQAHAATLQQMKRLLYDGDVTSNLAHRMRMMTGFMTAWEDSIAKWGRIVTDDPSVLVQGAKLWNAPSEIDLGETTEISPKTGQPERVPRFQVVIEKKDANGNGTGEWEKAGPISDIFDISRNAFIEVRLPESLASRLPGNYTKTWRISQASANLALQGNPWWLPSAGPLTQISLSEMAVRNPTTLTDVYKWGIPYGPETNWLKALAPAYIRRFWEKGESITDEAYGKAFVDIALTAIQNAKLHRRNQPLDDAFFNEIKDRTDAFYNLRAFVNFVAPFSMQAVSPYQFYVDEYRKLKAQWAGRVNPDGSPVDVDRIFIANFGDDLYMFATSLSKNNTGLPASQRAWELSQANRDLIARDPEMASIYLSDVDPQNFDQYVYAAQMEQQISPLSEQTFRERRNPAEAIRENRRNLGWNKYVKAMDVIHAMEDEPGADLAFLDFFRSYMGKKIARENPEFAEDYLKNEPEKIPDRIKKMQQLVMDKSIQSRPEIRQLTRYLVEREKFLSLLEQRKAEGRPYTLAAAENKPIADEWEAAQLRLAKENTLFGRIYWRWLRADVLQKSRLES